MNPLRWDVLLAGFVLALPVLALGLRGDLTVEEVTTRLLWCLAAGWGAVALVRLVTTPRTVGGPKSKPRPVTAATEPPSQTSEDTPAH